MTVSVDLLHRVLLPEIHFVQDFPEVAACGRNVGSLAPVGLEALVVELS